MKNVLSPTSVAQIMPMEFTNARAKPAPPAGVASPAAAAPLRGAAGAGGAIAPVLARAT